MNTQNSTAPASDLLSQREAATYLGGISHRTLESWRVSGGGPVFVRIGRSIRYRRSDLEAFIASGARRNTSEAGAK